MKLLVHLSIALAMFASQAAFGQFIPDPPGTDGPGGGIVILDTCEEIRDAAIDLALLEHGDRMVAALNTYNASAQSALDTLNAAIADPNCGIFCIQAAVTAYNNALALAAAIRDATQLNSQAIRDAEIQAALDDFEDCVERRNMA